MHNINILIALLIVQLHNFHALLDQTLGQDTCGTIILLKVFPLVLKPVQPPPFKAIKQMITHHKVVKPVPADGGYTGDCVNKAQQQYYEK